MSKGEDSRVIKRVGSYSTSQAEQKDCERCHDATWGTVLIDGLCLDCYVLKSIEREFIDKFQSICEESLCPETFDRFEVVRDELIETRHIPKKKKKHVVCSKCKVLTEEWCDVICATTGEPGVYCPACFSLFEANLEDVAMDHPQ